MLAGIFLYPVHFFPTALFSEIPLFRAFAAIPCVVTSIFSLPFVFSLSFFINFAGEIVWHTIEVTHVDSFVFIKVLLFLLVIYVPASALCCARRGVLL